MKMSLSAVNNSSIKIDMKKIIILAFLSLGSILSGKAQTISSLVVNAYPSRDTAMASRTMIDLLATFVCSQPQEIESVTMKVGNAAGQSQWKTTQSTVELQNENYYTINGKDIYKISENKIPVRATNLTYVEVKGKYITIRVKYKDGHQSEELSIQY
jgi:hypothetical protein